MSVGAIIIIVIAASGVLMMRFRKRWLAKINIVLTNRITGLFAGWLPGFGILTHVGRKHTQSPPTLRFWKPYPNHRLKSSPLPLFVKKFGKGFIHNHLDRCSLLCSVLSQLIMLI